MKTFYVLIWLVAFVGVAMMGCTDTEDSNNRYTTTTTTTTQTATMTQANRSTCVGLLNIGSCNNTQTVVQASHAQQQAAEYNDLSQGEFNALMVVCVFIIIIGTAVLAELINLLRS